jgi:HEAT repeat protein
VIRAALVLAVAFACEGPHRAEVRRVRARVDVVSFADGGGHLRRVPEKRAVWLTKRALAASRRLARIPVEHPGWTVEAQALFEVDPARREGRGSATVSIEGPAMDGAVRAVRSAQGALSGPADRGPLEKALARAVDAAAGLESLRRARPERQRAALSGDDPERLVVAVRGLAEHHRHEDVAAIVPLLEHPSGAVREAATGALVVLGDRSAVRALIDADDSGDPLVTIRTLDAVAALGGDEALAYVELLATGHPLETVRRTAFQARRRILRGERHAERE